MVFAEIGQGLRACDDDGGGGALECGAVGYCGSADRREG